MNIGLSALLKMLIARVDTVGLPMRVVTVVMRIIGFLFFMLHLGGFLTALGPASYFFVQEFLDTSVGPLTLLSTTWIVLEKRRDSCGLFAPPRQRTRVIRITRCSSANTSRAK